MKRKLFTVMALVMALASAAEGQERGAPVQLEHRKVRENARSECMEQNANDHEGFKRCFGDKKAELKQRHEERKAQREQNFGNPGGN